MDCGREFREHRLKKNAEFSNFFLVVSKMLHSSWGEIYSGQLRLGTKTEYSKKAVETLSIASTCGWNFAHLRELWSFGFRLSDISNFFDSIPSTLAPVLKTALNFLEDISERRVSELKKVCFGPLVCEVDIDECESRMWESTQECGCIQLFFDRQTRIRRDVFFNSRHSSIYFSLNASELFHRTTYFDVPFFCPEFDLLCLLVDDILHEFEDRIRCFRVTNFVDPSQNAVLVCCSVTRRFNGMGELAMVFAVMKSQSCCICLYFFL
jgi:hypothetical protein